jgi:hypothetical protein
MLSESAGIEMLEDMGTQARRLAWKELEWKGEVAVMCPAQRPPEPSLYASLAFSSG